MSRLCVDHCPMAFGALRNVTCGVDDKGLVYMYNRPGLLVEGRSGMKIRDEMELGEHA